MPVQARQSAALPQAPATDAARPAGSSRDVVVTGVRNRRYPVEVHTTERDGGDASLERQQVEEARFFSRCVSQKDGRLLRGVVDAPAGSEVHAAAFEALVAAHSACYPGFHPVMAWTRRNSQETFFDQGAMVEQALRLYAPGFVPTAAQTRDPAVLARLQSRQGRFEPSRSAAERRLSRLSICLVASHPETAAELLRSAVNGSGEARLAAALVGTAPACLGGVRQVSINPAALRALTADALYAWVVAARGVDSPIPSP